MRERLVFVFLSDILFWDKQEAMNGRPGTLESTLDIQWSEDMRKGIV